MTYPDVLDHFGCSEQRLREIFTTPIGPGSLTESAKEKEERRDEEAKPKEDEDKPKTDEEKKKHHERCNSKIHKRFQERVRSRMMDGIKNNLKSSRPNQAVDLAWDAPPLAQSIPLMLWAQGKIKIEALQANLCASMGEAQADRFFTKSMVKGKEVLKVDTGRITNITIDLLKSYVTRRHAAMDALWSNLWPLLRYEPRGQDDISMLRADALTQRVDIIADAYGYRHFNSQCRRQMLLYGYSVAFPQNKWDVKVGWRFTRSNTTGEATKETESYVEREGLIFVNPHPSRIYHDVSAPLANINTDTGPRYIGYWDVVRYGTLKSPSAPYFNLKDVFVSESWTQLANQYGDFLSYYFDPCVLKWPEMTGSDPTAANDRQTNIGSYSAASDDTGILLGHHFECINPKAEGIGDYDADVWLHLTVGGDATIIHAEFMPSTPAIYGAVNCNDSRLANQSMAQALLAYQDQATNITSAMLMQLRTSLIQLWLLDKDSLEPDIIQSFKDNANDADWWVDRKILIYSASKLRDAGVIDPSQSFKVIQAQVHDVFKAALEALNQLLNLADRLLILSPNELGQPNPREVSAREVTDISTAVQSMYAFISQGPREMVAAQKELVYESLICCARQNFRVPVQRRYTPAVIEAAGMAVAADVKLPGNGDIVPTNTPIMGNLSNLIYDYYFDSRDGAERPVNTQGATVIQQLMQNLLQIEPLAQKIGINNLMAMMNTIIRMSGAPTTFQFDLPVGVDNELEPPAPDAAPIEALQKDMADVKTLLAQMAQAMSGQPPAGAPGAAPPPPPATAMLQEPQELAA